MHKDRRNIYNIKSIEKNDRKINELQSSCAEPKQSYTGLATRRGFAARDNSIADRFLWQKIKVSEILLALLWHQACVGGAKRKSNC